MILICFKFCWNHWLSFIFFPITGGGQTLLSMCVIGCVLWAWHHDSSWNARLYLNTCVLYTLSDNVSVIGSDDATTCHLVVLRHTGETCLLVFSLVSLFSLQTSLNHVSHCQEVELFALHTLMVPTLLLKSPFLSSQSHHWVPAVMRAGMKQTGSTIHYAFTEPPHPSK